MWQKVSKKMVLEMLIILKPEKIQFYRFKILIKIFREKEKCQSKIEEEKVI